ncbi:sphingosine 1-phosphate receptor 3-like [Corticium candelabrum]|uniref:sphingosine 1-phosphate receptor 3-like n=1 Tax=Corticium candelabrum TaxID=121492 RepID=UPI002E26F066|nr:sphingosine 1-phosphate receptor 3-like [Corticium candelabrum]
MATTNNATSPVKGITEKAFHVSLWILLATGITANAFVILWRCCRKSSGFCFLSVFIVSLAVADLLFCCHFMLQEVLLVGVVFNEDRRNQTFSQVDGHVCLASTFTFYVSCNAVALTATGIAFYTLLAMRGKKTDKALSVFIVICWVVSSALAGWGTSRLNTHFTDHQVHRNMSSEMYSLNIMFGCMGDVNMIIVPTIIASLNFASSTICSALYLLVCSTLRKSTVVDFENAELKHLKVRLAIIALMNLVGWWPACALYWYSIISGNNVFNGRLDPDITKPAFLLAVTVSATNPVIYTIASRPLLKFLRRICCVCLNGGSEERRPFLVRYFVLNREVDTRWRTCCGLKCERREMTTMSNDTDQSSLFPESTNRTMRVETECPDDYDKDA